MAFLKFLNENNQWEVVETPGVLKSTEQTLTEAQKAQVKANLGITADLNSKIAIYNNVKPSTFDWWSAIKYATNRSTIDSSIYASGAFQVNLAANCSFVTSATLSSALINFSLRYYAGAYMLYLTTEYEGDVYRSEVFGSFPGPGYTDFIIPDNIPFTKVTQSAMIVEIGTPGDGNHYSSKSTQDIYNHVQNGGTVYAVMEGSYWSLLYAGQDTATFCNFTDDGFIERMFIFGTSVDLWTYDEAVITSRNLKDYLDNNDVAYKSDLPKTIPTSTIDALLS
jgi:hypothetical protein